MLLTVSNTLAQNYFVRTIGDATIDQTAKGVWEAPDGTLYLIGYAGTNNGGDIDIALVKLDSNGDLIWEKQFGTPADEYAEDFALSPSKDGFVIVGSQSDGNDSQAYAIAIDTSGRMLWSNSYGALNSNEAFARVVRLTDDSYAICGQIGAGQANNVLATRINSIGDTLWVKTFGRSSINELGTGLATNDSAQLIIGADIETLAGPYNQQVLKVDSSGNLIWNTVIASPYNSGSKNLRASGDGAFLISGMSATDSSFVFAHYLTKVDENGNVLWNRRFGRANGEHSYDILVRSNTDILLAGFGGNGGMQAMVLGVGQNGVELPNSYGYYGGVEMDNIYAVIEASSGGYLAAGFSQENGVRNYSLIHDDLQLAEQITAIEEFKKVSILVYPNTVIAGGKIVLEANNLPVNVQLVDLSGRLFELEIDLQGNVMIPESVIAGTYTLLAIWPNGSFASDNIIVYGR